MTWYRNPVQKPVAPDVPLLMNVFQLQAGITAQAYRIRDLLARSESILPAYERQRLLDNVGIAVRSHSAAGKYLAINRFDEAISLLERAYRTFSYLIFFLEKAVLRGKR